MLSTKDLISKERLVKKLVDQYVGLNIIDEIVSTNAVKLQLLTLMRIHQIENVSFLAGIFLNTKPFILSITLLFFFYFFVSFLPLSACFSCIFLNTTSTFSYTFIILFTNSNAFSTFLFFLISASILNSPP